MTIIWTRTNANDAALTIEAVQRALADAERRDAEGGPDIPMGDPYLAEQVDALRAQWPVDTAAVLPGGAGSLGRLVGAARSLARRATWWYQLPQWQQVHQFHGTSVRVIDTLLAGLAQVRQRVLLLEEQAAKVKSLEEQLSIAYERQRHLLEEVERLRADVDRLKQQ
jgi:hypothetical protein